MDIAHYLVDRKARARRVLSHLRPYLSGSVLDFGAGDCNLISLIDAEAELQGHGIDVMDYRQVSDFKNFEPYDGKRIPFPDNHFDTVISVYVVHHIKDQVGALSEMTRVLKPGGTIIMLEDSFNGVVGEKLAELYDILTNAASFQVPVELNFHSPADWKALIEGATSLRVSEMMPLRLGPICRVVPLSVYFKLLIVSEKPAV